jgi:acyl-CoA synthetase (AMP-forming)/AMP-acid ligase II
MCSNVGELLLQKTKEFPNNIFIICNEEQYTYQKFYNLCLGVASYITNELKISHGDTISICYKNNIDFLTSYFACLIMGVKVVTINPDLSKRELDYIVKNSESKCLLSSEYDYNFEVNKMTIPDIKTNDDAVIIYTSGTTGAPKGVVLTHKNLLSDAEAIADWFQFDNGTNTMCILPLFHNNGQITTLLAPLFSGGTTIILDPQTALLGFWDFVKYYEITFTSVVPTMLSMLLNIDKERCDKTLKAILCGGQPLKKIIQHSFEKKYGVNIYEGYGLTETTSFSCINDYPVPQKKGSVGRPLPCNEMIIIDGEICIRGKNVTNGYHNLPRKNKEVFDKAGWFHSGDFGEQDEEGYFYFKERRDFLIIRGGENIYPTEIENIILGNDNVVECAVIGVNDDLLGQVVCAIVKLYDNNKRDILEFCRDKIANYKLPSNIIYVDNIPKGPTNKILYKELMAKYG